MFSSEIVTEVSDRRVLERIIETSDINLAQSVKEIAADVSYSGYANYEYLGKNNKIGYILDQNLRKDLKGKDIFLCPEGKKLKIHHIRQKDYPYRKFQTKIQDL